MKRVLVIGIGSLVMRDDGIGSRVVEAIAESLREHDMKAACVSMISSPSLERRIFSAALMK